MNLESNHNFHRDLLRTLAARMKPACFIELGLGPNPAIGLVSEFCEKAYGVDRVNCNVPAQPNAIILEMSTDQFFADVAPSIPAPELVFIDADHSKESVLRDLENVAAIAAENCVVVLHDTFPENAQQTHPTFCGDSYLVPREVVWEHVTLPTPPGVTICRLNARSLV